MAHNEQSAGSGVALGLDWNATNTDGGTYKIAPTLWRYDPQSTDNYGSSWSEYLYYEPSGSTGHWTGGWGSGSGWRQYDSFSTRTYTKKHSSYTVKITIDTDSDFGTWNGGWITLGSKYFAWTTTIPARTSYTVSFNNNGGSGSPSAQTKWYGESLTLSSTKPSYSGYAFKRWNTNTSDTGTAYNSGASYTGNAALTLYAIWNRTVTYNKNTTDDVGSMPSNQTGVKSSAITLSSNTPTRTDYKFYHWNTGSGNGGTTYNKGGSYAANNPNVTLYAIWNPILYYKPNGASGSDTSQDKTYGTAATLKASDTYSRTGFTFRSWNTAADASGTAYSAGASYTANTTTTLYAIWDATVSYNANGGAGAPENQVSRDGTTVTIGAAPTRSGHTFLEWNTASDGTGTTYQPGDTYSMSNGDLTLYAKWRVDIQLTNVTCSLVDSNGTADPLGKYVSIGADYDATLSGENVQSITATMTHSEVDDSDSETSGLGLTGHVDFTFGPYDYADFDPHGNYQAGTLSAVNELGEVEVPLNIAATSYRDPSVNSVTAFRTETSTVGGVLVHEPADDGTDVGIDVSWTAFSSGSQTKQFQVRIERSDGTLIATRTFSNLTVGPTRLDVWADPNQFPDDVLVRGVLLPTDSQFTVTVTLVDAYAAEITSAKSSRADLVTIGYFTLDFLGDAYLYNKTDDITVDPDKQYYTRSGLGTTEVPYVFTEVANPVDADLGNYYEANGHRPGHGIAMGKPSTKEGLDVGMETWFEQDVHVGEDVDIDGTLDVASSVTSLEGMIVSDETDAVFVSTAPNFDLSLANNGLESGVKYPAWYAMDNAGRIMSRVEGVVNSNGSNGVQMYARNYDVNGDSVGQKGIAVHVAKDGTSTWSVSDPANFRTAINSVNKSGDTMTGDLTLSDRKAYRSTYDQNVRRNATAPSSAVYGSGQYVNDSNGDNIFYSEMAWTTDRKLYRSFIVRRLDSSGANAVTNGFYLGINNDGTKYVTVTDAAAWRTALGFGTDLGWTNLATATNFYIKYMKRGRIVFVVADSRGGKTASTSGYTTLGTLPSGYRPNIEFWAASSGIGSSTNFTIHCTTGGVVGLNASSGGGDYWSFLISFPVA